MGTNQSLKLLGKDFTCLVCRNATFEVRSLSLKNPGGKFTLFGKEGENAAVLICEHCGYVHWFMPEKTNNPTTETPVSNRESDPGE